MHPTVACRMLTCAAVFSAVCVVMTGLPVRAAPSLDQFTVIVGGWQLERRCEHLEPGQRAALGQIAAHAEIDMAGKHGSAKVREVLAGAKQFGEEMGANCGDETGEAVKRSYGVAREYAAARAAAQDNTQVATPSTTPQTPKKKKPAGRKDLARFGKQTEAYYLQLRCKYLSYDSALNFWKMIARRHHALIGKYGAGPVGRTSRGARASAQSASVSCGARTNGKIERGVNAIRRDLAAN